MEESEISMGFAGYITVCVQLYCVSFHRLSLHVSAYMAIFKCVGYFYFHMSEGFYFAAFFLSYSFRHVKIKISYTLEDGHVRRNM
jgi:hypothetical protein